MATDDVSTEALTLRQRREQHLNRERFHIGSPRLPLSSSAANSESLSLSGTERSRCILYRESWEKCAALAYRKHKPVTLYCSMEHKDLEECKTQFMQKLRDDALLQKQQQLKKEGKWPPPNMPEPLEEERPVLRLYGDFGVPTY